MKSRVRQRVRSGRLSESAVKQIRALIVDGNLQQGDKLPSERALVEEMALSRASVREALRILEAMRIIRVLPRKGSYVQESPEANGVWAKLVDWLTENRDAIVEILDVREALDTKAAALAAGEATPGDLKTIELHIGKMAKAIAAEDLDAIVEADINFHLAIASASHNEFLHHLSKVVTYLLNESRKMLFALPGRAEKSLAEHREVVTAIRSHAPLRAQQLMHAHTESVKVSFERRRRDSAAIIV